jgi:hypothetical protein
LSTFTAVTLLEVSESSARSTVPAVRELERVGRLFWVKRVFDCTLLFWSEGFVSPSLKPISTYTGPLPVTGSVTS